MPNYDFACGSCGNKFTQNLPLGTKHADCPMCGKQATKTFTAPAVHFATKGFYSVDSKAKTKELPAAKESSPAASLPPSTEPVPKALPEKTGN